MNEDNRMNDLISRNKAIRLYCRENCGCEPEECPLTYEQDGTEDCSYIRFLKELPSVQPEQKRGKWIESTELSEQVKGKKFCSNCGKAQYAIEITDKTIQIKSGTSKFCPNCGAKMEE